MAHTSKATDTTPWRSEPAEALLAEHAQMAEQLAALLHRAAAETSGTRRRQSLADEFTNFMNRFSAHEEAENGLLQKSDQHDTGAED